MCCITVFMDEISFRNRGSMKLAKFSLGDMRETILDGQQKEDDEIISSIRNLEFVERIGVNLV